MIFQPFPALHAIPRIRAGFTGRIPGADVCVEREEALARLKIPLSRARADLGFGRMLFATAEQVHGSVVREVSEESRFPIAGADGLLTTRPGICLGIYVADCAAVYLADRLGRGIALVHSGKKGTELGIAPRAAEALCRTAEIPSSDLVAWISPCIRPPCYEMDFASEIVRQLHEFGVGSVQDSGVCTACRNDLYYSYRLEKGRTGRMLALMAILPDPEAAKG